MSEEFPRYFRATIDFTVLDPEDRLRITKALVRGKGVETNDEALAKRFEYEVGGGFIQIDGISNIEIF